MTSIHVASKRCWMKRLLAKNNLRCKNSESLDGTDIIALLPVCQTTRILYSSSQMCAYHFLAATRMMLVHRLISSHGNRGPGGRWKYVFRKIRDHADTIRLQDGDEIVFCKGENGQMIDHPTHFLH